MSLRRKTLIYFSSTVFNSALSFLVLPLATKVLTPADYGKLGALNAVANAFGAFCCASIGYVLSAKYLAATHTERREIVSSALVSVICLSLLGMGIMVIAIKSLGSLIADSVAFTSVEIAISCIGIFSTSIWAVASDVFILSGQAGRFSVAVITQGLIQMVMLLVSLYWWSLGGISLFIGLAAGNITLIIISIILLGNNIGPHAQYALVKEYFKTTFIASSANFTELLYPWLERWLLTGYIGLSSVGLYTHAQTYSNILFTVVKSAGRSIWPITLNEAREENPMFPHTRRLWGVWQMLITAVAVCFAAIGDVFISILTHGKFIDAHLYATAMLVILVAKHTGRAENGLLYSQGDVKILSSLNFFSSILAMISLGILVPFFGTWGAVSSMGIQILVYRLGLLIAARSKGLRGSSEPWLIRAPVLVGATIMIKLAFTPGILGDLILIATATAALGLVGRLEVTNAFHMLLSRRAQTTA